MTPILSCDLTVTPLLGDKAQLILKRQSYSIISFIYTQLSHISDFKIVQIIVSTSENSHFMIGSFHLACNKLKADMGIIVPMSSSSSLVVAA